MDKFKELEDLKTRCLEIADKADSLRALMSYGWKRNYKKTRLELSAMLRDFKKDISSINARLIQLEREYSEYLKNKKKDK